MARIIVVGAGIAGPATARAARARAGRHTPGGAGRDGGPARPEATIRRRRGNPCGPLMRFGTMRQQAGRSHADNAAPTRDNPVAATGHALR